MDEIQNLVYMSKYAGMRFDLVQAGGGNTSVKLDDGVLLVKASGINLAQMTATSGIARTALSELQNFVGSVQFEGLTKNEIEATAKSAMDSSNLDKSARPSIETFLHAITPGKYTLHTHPIAVNVLASREDWANAVQRVLPKALCVEYQTPGVELAVALNRRLQNAQQASCAVLQNHGLIVWGDSIQAVLDETEAICQKLEHELRLSFVAYRELTEIWKTLAPLGFAGVVYLSNDANVVQILRQCPEYLSLAPFCPDVFVYCGVSACITSQSDELLGYIKENGAIPKLIFWKHCVYIIAGTLQKARETEELLRFSLLVAESNDGKQSALSPEELFFLGNWESEKWRQQV